VVSGFGNSMRSAAEERLKAGFGFSPKCRLSVSKPIGMPTFRAGVVPAERAAPFGDALFANYDVLGLTFVENQGNSAVVLTRAILMVRNT